ncbi:MULTISPECIES: MFS transporter [unclassified Kitasatospora]|uniref:MFS transporter n=1 Tax=unclassified Kitasatospora TaxID=2633591 RepID=UPI0033CDACD0
MTGRLRSFFSLLGWWDVLATPGTSRILGVNGLVDAAGMGLSVICLPFYLVQVEGLSNAQLAVVLTAGGITEMLAAVPAGALAGRFGIGPYSVLSRIGRAAVYLGLVLVHDFVSLLLLTVLLGALRAGSNGLMQSLVGVVIPGDSRTGMFAAIRALRNIGYLVAGSVGALLLSSGSGTAVRAGLLVNAATFAVGAVLMYAVRVKSVAPEESRKTDWSVLRDFNYLGLIASSAVFTSSILVLSVALPLWVLRTGDIPKWTVGVVVIINTALVIVLQHWCSQVARTVAGSLRALRIAMIGFVAMVGLFCVSALHSAALATVAVLLAGAMLTVGELFEGPAWWTISYELAPPERNKQYLAAFDLNMAAVNVAGPVLCVAMIQAGWLGWLVYGALLVAATALAHRLVAVRTRRTAPATVETGVAV